MTRDLLQPTTVIIPVSTAIERTTNWRDFMQKNATTADPKMLPKAVYVSRADIEQLSALMLADETLMGVRAYFTIDTPAAEAVSNDISFVMVPVRAQKGKPNGVDVLYKTGSKGNADSEDDSEVYDYTLPCPDVCDPESPLFGG